MAEGWEGLNYFLEPFCKGFFTLSEVPPTTVTSFSCYHIGLGEHIQS